MTGYIWRGGADWAYRNKMGDPFASNNLARMLNSPPRREHQIMPQVSKKIDYFSSHGKHRMYVDDSDDVVLLGQSRGPRIPTIQRFVPNEIKNYAPQPRIHIDNMNQDCQTPSTLRETVISEMECGYDDMPTLIPLTPENIIQLDEKIINQPDIDICHSTSSYLKRPEATGPRTSDPHEFNVPLSNEGLRRQFSDPTHKNTHFSRIPDNDTRSQHPKAPKPCAGTALSPHSACCPLDLSSCPLDFTLGKSNVGMINQSSAFKHPSEANKNVHNLYKVDDVSYSTHTNPDKKLFLPQRIPGTKQTEEEKQIAWENQLQEIMRTIEVKKQTMTDDVPIHETTRLPYNPISPSRKIRSTNVSHNISSHPSSNDILREDMNSYIQQNQATHNPPDRDCHSISNATESHHNSSNDRLQVLSFSSQIGNYFKGDILFVHCRLCSMSYGNIRGITRHFLRDHGRHPDVQSVVVETVSGHLISLPSTNPKEESQMYSNVCNIPSRPASLDKTGIPSHEQHQQGLPKRKDPEFQNGLVTERVAESSQVIPSPPRNRSVDDHFRLPPSYPSDSQFISPQRQNQSNNIINIINSNTINTSYGNHKPEYSFPNSHHIQQREFMGYANSLTNTPEQRMDSHHIQNGVQKNSIISARHSMPMNGNFHKDRVQYPKQNPNYFHKQDKVLPSGENLITIPRPNGNIMDPRFGKQPRFLNHHAMYKSHNDLKMSTRYMSPNINRFLHNNHNLSPRKIEQMPQNNTFNHHPFRVSHPDMLYQQIQVVRNMVPIDPVGMDYLKANNYMYPPNPYMCNSQVISSSKQHQKTDSKTSNVSIQHKVPVLKRKNTSFRSSDGSPSKHSKAQNTDHDDSLNISADADGIHECNEGPTVHQKSDQPSQDCKNCDSDADDCVVISHRPPAKLRSRIKNETQNPLSKPSSDAYPGNSSSPANDNKSMDSTQTNQAHEKSEHSPCPQTDKTDDDKPIDFLLRDQTVKQETPDDCLVDSLEILQGQTMHKEPLAKATSEVNGSSNCTDNISVCTNPLDFSNLTLETLVENIICRNVKDTDGSENPEDDPPKPSDQNPIPFSEQTDCDLQKNNGPNDRKVESSDTLCSVKDTQRFDNADSLEITTEAISDVTISECMNEPNNMKCSNTVNENCNELSPKPEEQKPLCSSLGGDDDSKERTTAIIDQYAPNDGGSCFSKKADENIKQDIDLAENKNRHSPNKTLTTADDTACSTISVSNIPEDIMWEQENHCNIKSKNEDLEKPLYIYLNNILQQNKQYGPPRLDNNNITY